MIRLTIRLALLAMTHAAAVLLPLNASANDSTAEMGTGGLVLGRSDAISMDSEVLSISMQRIDVDYVFKNITDQDVETLVAFPMPDIAFSPDGMVAIPQIESDNFLGFTVTVDGAPITPQLEQRAIANGVDVSATLKELGVPLQPLSAAGGAALDGLDAAAKARLAAMGAVLLMEGAADGATPAVAGPTWTLQSTYFWPMTFPAGQSVRVSHSYVPSLGGTAGVSFVGPYADKSYVAEYRARYCMDDAFIAAVEKRMPADGSIGDGPYYTESRIEYVLRTGANWAGSIKNFTLRIDKGSPDNLVSFCAEGVKKTGPTTFEVNAQDFWPERDLSIVFVVKG